MITVFPPAGAWRATAVEAAEVAAALVVVDQRRGLLVVDLEPLLDGLRLVVVALNEPRAVLVADALVLGGVVVDVVDVLVLDAYAAARDALDDLVVGGVDQEDGRQAAATAVEGVLEDVGLLGVAREAVQQEAVLGLGLVDALHDHVADDLVGHEVALGHVALCLLAQRRLVLHRRPEDVAGRVIGKIEVRNKALGLGSLAGTRRPEEDQVELTHLRKPS
jgi:hypothetical protein